LARRELLSKCMALGVLTSTANLLPSALAAAWQAKEKSRLAPTPAAELGPFYKRLAPSNSAMRAPGDPGMPLVVTGQVFSSRGGLIPSAIVEIWQTNHEGLYDLDGYHYRTKLTTPADGKYEFSSVMPGHYPARVCQHIHYAVTAPACWRQCDGRSAMDYYGGRCVDFVVCTPGDGGRSAQTGDDLDAGENQHCFGLRHDRLGRGSRARRGDPRLETAVG
jgi:hypothetical protein